MIIDDAGGAYFYDRDAAERVVEYFERYLVHVKGEWYGMPFELADWQADDVIRPLFGWKRALPNVPQSKWPRRFRKVWCEWPRGNGKSTIAAGLGLYLASADGEPGCEVYSAAADREQASIVFDVARSMVEESPALFGRAEVYRRSIVFPRLRSFYKVISSDVRTKHGFNAHGIIFDEFHAQPNRELYDVLRTSMGKRRQPVFFGITTAGRFRPRSSI